MDSHKEVGKLENEFPCDHGGEPRREPLLERRTLAEKVWILQRGRVQLCKVRHGLGIGQPKQGSLSIHQHCDGDVG